MASPTRRSYHLTYAVLAVSFMAFALLQSLVVPVLGVIQAEMHTSQTTATWLLTAYLLSASVATPILGRVGDAVGKTKVLVLALGALALGSLLAAISPTIWLMLVARVIQGLGGGVMPLAFGIIRDEFPKAKISGAVAILASLGAVGVGCGSIIAGPIVDLLGFRWLFWLPMIVTTIAAVAAWFVIPPSPVRTPGGISWTPALLLSSWLVCLLLGLSQGPTWGWSSPTVLGLLIAAVIAAAMWVYVECHVAVPLIDMRMMRLPAVWTTNAVALLLGVGMYATFGFVPRFVQTSTEFGYGFGASITESGIMLLPSAIASFILGFLTAGFARRWGPKRVVVVGCLLAAVSMFMIAFMHEYLWQMYVANAVQGIGNGLVFSCMASLIVAAVPAEQTGVASGMNANIRTIGGAIGTAVMSSIVTAFLLSDGTPAETGYTIGFAVLGGTLLLAATAALFIPPVSPEEYDEIEEELEDEGVRSQLGWVAAGTVVSEKPE